MRTPYHSAFEPFELRSNVIYFHDWRYVYHGGTRWETPDGVSSGLWSPDPVPPLHWAGQDIPTGVRLRALPARKSEPFVRPDCPWEGITFGSSLIHEGGRYRLWYETVPPADIVSGRAGEGNLLCYAESEDGETWRKPVLGQYEYDGSRDNNIVYGGSLAPEASYHGGNVFLDPSAPPHERYKVFHLCTMSLGVVEAYKRRYPHEVDPHLERTPVAWGMRGATSPDGIHWTPLPEPLLLQVSDTQNIAYYDRFLGKYVAYMRTWVMGKRAIGRSESADFRHFPLPETFLWPDASLSPSDLWYCNGKTVYPDADDYHLLFPKRWHVAQDRFYQHVATSPDGILWGFPPDNQVLVPGERGDWDAGGVNIGCGMVELPGDRVAVPYTGDRIPHKYARHAPLGAIAWASWDRERLVALEAEEEGSFRTTSVLFKGQTLHLNARTHYSGHVRVEVVRPNGEVLPGRALADCDPFSGDCLDRTVTWHGESHLGRQGDEPLAFRVRLAAGQLFAMRFG